MRSDSDKTGASDCSIAKTALGGALTGRRGKRGFLLSVVVTVEFGMLRQFLKMAVTFCCLVRLYDRKGDRYEEYGTSVSRLL